MRRAATSERDTDLLEVIERAYDIDATPEAWLLDLSQRFYAAVGQGLGMSAFFYRITDEGRVDVGHDLTLDTHAPPPFPLRDALAFLPPDFVRKSFALCECTTQSAAMDPAMREQLGPMLEAAGSMLGWRDAVMLGGMDPTGNGVYFGAWLPEETRLSPRERSMWSRVAVHIATANRLRRLLRGARESGLPAPTGDAVLRPDGRLEHVEADANSREARDALREAVLRMETARGKMRHDEPHKAVDAWRGLVSCRWSLVDHFESDGKRYVVARRNDAVVRGSQALTQRERQTVSYAALNHSNKLIAYEMGISPSTVGVLLHRAAKKLGVRSRQALLDAFVPEQRERA